jgi:hypothetical protein
MKSSNIIGIYTGVLYTYIIMHKIKKKLVFVFKYFMSIHKIHFYNSISKVFLTLFYSNTSIKILIL